MEIFKSYKGFGCYMDDKVLFKIALFVSLVGLVLLLYISDVDEVAPVSDVSEVGEDDVVKLNGEVLSVRSVEGLTIINLDVEGDVIKVVASGDVNLSVGDVISVEGKMIIYNGELELEASRVVKG